MDATSGGSGNTTLANGAVFSPPLNGTTGVDNNWEQRTVLGSSGNIFESGGEAAENAPELRATISGLIPGANYATLVFFWDATGTTENWSIRSGFSSAPGVNPLYSAADATGTLGASAAVLASTLTYVTAPTLFTEANRVLLAASLGTTTADGNGLIRVFLDDRPSTIGANNRTWFDGLGWALSLAMYPTNLLYALAGNTLAISWPATHVGWRLETQSNPGGTGLGTNWVTVTNSTTTNQHSVTLNPANGSVFYRLAYP